MSKIKNFDRTNIQALRPPIEDALKNLATKYGISVKLGNASFSPSSVTFKLELATISADGLVCSKEVQDFKNYASMFGLKPDDLGKTFKDINGEVYTIVGAKLHSQKYPILVESASSGKRFKFPERRVQLGLKLQVTGEV